MPSYHIRTKETDQEGLHSMLDLIVYRKMHLFYNKGAKQLHTSVRLIKLDQSLSQVMFPAK